MASSETPKMIIVDEHEIVRDGIATLIERDGAAKVVGSAADGYSAIKECRKNTPEIVLMDLGITRPKGMDTFRKIRAAHPEAMVIVYASEIDQANVFTLLAAGAKGFVPKQATGSDFVNAVRSASLGYVSIPDEHINGLVGLRKNARETGNCYGLSPREMEVFEACASGTPTKEVADQLDISVRTVETHRNAIYRKTSCHSISDLVELADRLDMLADTT